MSYSEDGMPVRIKTKVSPTNPDPIEVPAVFPLARPVVHIDLYNSGPVSGEAALEVIPSDHPLRTVPPDRVTAESEWRFLDDMARMVQDGSRGVKLPKVRLEAGTAGEYVVIGVPLRGAVEDLGGIPVTPGMELSDDADRRVLVGDAEGCWEYARTLEYNFKVDHLADVVFESAQLATQIERDLRQWLKNLENHWRANPDTVDTTVDLERLAEDILTCHWDTNSGWLFSRAPEYEMLAHLSLTGPSATDRADIQILLGYRFMDGVKELLGDIRATVFFR